VTFGTMSKDCTCRARGYGTGSHTERTALKVRKKVLARLNGEDGDSLVMPGVRQDERDMLVERARRCSISHHIAITNGADRCSKAKRADVEPLLRRHGERWRQRRDQM